MICRRSVACLLPSAFSATRASSQRPYSAWSVRMRLATSLVVPRGRWSTRYEYSAITFIVRDPGGGSIGVEENAFGDCGNTRLAVAG